MGNKIFRTMIFAIFTSTILLTASPAAENASSLEEWVPCVPNPDMVELQYLERDGVSYVNVSITFASSGFNVSDWGIPIFDENSISVDAKIWIWTGVSLPVVITVKHLYNLGFLPPGEYNFTFKVWGFNVKSITFVVREGANFDIDPPCGGGLMPRLY
jgi:hypothetical protein